jgi:hypothetical protein
MIELYTWTTLNGRKRIALRYLRCAKHRRRGLCSVRPALSGPQGRGLRGDIRPEWYYLPEMRPEEAILLNVMTRLTTAAPA